MRCARVGSRPCRNAITGPDRRQVARLLRHEGLDDGLCSRAGIASTRAATARKPSRDNSRRTSASARSSWNEATAARTQKAGQVGGGRIRRIQLRHRRDDGQHA